MMFKWLQKTHLLKKAIFYPSLFVICVIVAATLTQTEIYTSLVTWYLVVDEGKHVDKNNYCKAPIQIQYPVISAQDYFWDY